MRKKTVLQTVKKPHPKASILNFTVAPGFKGSDNEDLLCGSCHTVISDGFSLATISSRFVTPAQLVMTCGQCGAYNVLPAIIDPESVAKVVRSRQKNNRLH